MKSAKRKPHATSLVLLLLCIFAFWLGISFLVQPVQKFAAPLTTTAAQPLLVHETITGATHTYSGMFDPGSPCDSFGSGIRYSAANGGHVSVLLVTEPASVACAQAQGASSGEPFSVSIKVSTASAPMFDGVLLNGIHIPAQLMEGN